jgi:hypothetical protein
VVSPVASGDTLILLLPNPPAQEVPTTKLTHGLSGLREHVAGGGRAPGGVHSGVPARFLQEALMARIERIRPGQHVEAVACMGDRWRNPGPPPLARAEDSG